MKELEAGEFVPGEYTKSFELPETVRSGFYILELRTPHDKVSKKLIIK